MVDRHSQTTSDFFATPIFARRLVAAASAGWVSSVDRFKLMKMRSYMQFPSAISGLILLTCLTGLSRGDDVTIRVDARQPGRPVSRYLTGACIEDVNHEIYGGIYSQMLFGESFQEPPRRQPVAGFVAVDGQWRAADGEVSGEAGPGPKLVSSSFKSHRPKQASTCSCWETPQAIPA